MHLLYDSCLYFSLPQTVEIKMIDVWMLVTFFYPFLVITLQMSIYLTAKHCKNPKLVNRLKMIGRVVLPVIAVVFVVMYMSYALRVYKNIIWFDLIKLSHLYLQDISISKFNSNQTFDKSVWNRIRILNIVLWISSCSWNICFYNKNCSNLWIFIPT